MAGIRDYGVFLLDPAGRVASWNSGAERILHYRESEIVGQHFSVFYTEADNAAGRPAQELQTALVIGHVEEEGWLVRSNGSRIWANVVITSILDERGNLAGFGAIARDTTDSRAAEQRYRLLVEGVTDYAIYSMDRKGHVVSWNAGAQSIKGYSDLEVIGKHLSQFYLPSEVEDGVPERVLTIAEESGHYKGEGWRVRKDGSRFWSSVVITALRSDQGELLGFSKITRDITDRKELLDQIRQHAEELELRIAEREQTNAELEAFSYSVSHDLRAPLRAIEGFTQAFVEDFGGELDPRGLEYLNKVTDAAGRMNLLVQDLLSFSRLSRVQLELKPVEIGSAIMEAMQQVAGSAEILRMEIAPGLRVIAHKATLVQSLVNVIGNGIKFQGAGEAPRVVVSTMAVNGNVRISVRDNGIGIALEHQDRIFQVFERLHGPEEYPGTGIGLAIVKRGIERMGGSVGLESKLGEGSTFWISLPGAA